LAVLGVGSVHPSTSEGPTTDASCTFCNAAADGRLNTGSTSCFKFDFFVLCKREDAFCLEAACLFVAEICLRGSIFVICGTASTGGSGFKSPTRSVTAAGFRCNMRSTLQVWCCVFRVSDARVGKASPAMDEQCVGGGGGIGGGGHLRRRMPLAARPAPTYISARWHCEFR
jgi:hypothetical protein